jgi:hypothetical protein
MSFYPRKRASPSAVVNEKTKAKLTGPIGKTAHMTVPGPPTVKLKTQKRDAFCVRIFFAGAAKGFPPVNSSVVGLSQELLLVCDDL